LGFQVKIFSLVNNDYFAQMGIGFLTEKFFSGPNIVDGIIAGNKVDVRIVDVKRIA